MSSIKRLRAPLIVMSGVVMGVVAFAGPASASDGYTSPVIAPQVLGTTATAPQVLGTTVTAQAPVAAAATSGLAFTGTNAIGIGALGGLLLVGGATMVVTGKRRKVND